MSVVSTASMPTQLLAHLLLPGIQPSPRRSRRIPWCSTGGAASIFPARISFLWHKGPRFSCPSSSNLRSIEVSCQQLRLSCECRLPSVPPAFAWNASLTLPTVTRTTEPGLVSSITRAPKRAFRPVIDATSTVSSAQTPPPVLSCNLLESVTCNLFLQSSQAIPQKMLPALT